MAHIVTLPHNAIQRLGSGQCLTDPCSLIKELVENSLDAQASLVYVEVSPNALDKVRVRDNGHGISPADRGMIGKRHCTSKIRNLEDLERLGGQSLGFRGEALASAAELSSKMTISTRVEEESVASVIEYNLRGENTRSSVLF